MATRCSCETGTSRHDGVRWFSVVGEWSEACRRRYVESGATALALTYEHWRGDDVSFVAGLPGLTSVSIFRPRIKDLTPVLAVPGLRALSMESTKFPTMASAVPPPTLESLDLKWCPAARPLLQARGLRSLICVGLPDEDLTGLSQLTRLEYLRIDSRRLLSTKGIAALPAIERVVFSGCTKLADVNELWTLPRLWEVELAGCGSLGHIRGVERCKTLKSLTLENCKDIESLRPLAALPALEILDFTGTTVIGDRDVALLAKLPALKKVFFQPRRIYNTSLNQIAEAIGMLGESGPTTGPGYVIVDHLDP